MQIPRYNSIKKNFERVQLAYTAKWNNIDPLKNYLLFSDPRGGSTWLSEIIKEIIKCPIIWEPLHINMVSQFRELGFGWRQFIPENEYWYESKNTFDNLFSGKILNKWLINKCNPLEILISKQLIFKICRGNMLLPYLTKNYNFKYKPIYLIRHPFAVVSSQLNHGGWENNYKSFVIPEVPFNEVYKIHKEFLSTLKTKEESLTATWCITNQIALNHKDNNTKWITLNYEELLLNPMQSIERIIKEWNISYDVEMIDFGKKSSTTISGSPISGRDQMGYWQKNLDEDMISRMKDVLTYFEIKEYSDRPEPLIIYK